MKVSLIASVQNFEKGIRASIYRQEDGGYFVIKVKTEVERRSLRDEVVERFRDLSRAEAMTLAELGTGGAP